jgi:hypothetical protein
MLNGATEKSFRGSAQSAGYFFVFHDEPGLSTSDDVQECPVCNNAAAAPTERLSALTIYQFVLWIAFQQADLLLEP